MQKSLVKNILIISQVYAPDTASVAQHLRDLAVELSSRGHKITVVASKHGFDNDAIYPGSEVLDGVNILRVGHTTFRKRNSFLRMFDFLTCIILMSLRVGRLKQDFDIVLTSTSPPLAGIIGALYSKIKKTPFVYWVMDLQPELAVKSGLLATRNPIAILLQYVSDWISISAYRLIALDEYMSAYLASRGVDKRKIFVSSVWPVSEGIYDGKRLENPFRVANDFGDKIVIMFSGNHSFVHPMKTLLETIRELKHEKKFLFCFVGGGVRVKEVREFKEKYQIENIVQYDYQPRSKFHISIGASDLQVVLLGDGQVGFTHPNKIYGSMFLGKPIIYIGPNQSHIGDILKKNPGNLSVEHGESEKLAKMLRDILLIGEGGIAKIGTKNRAFAENKFRPERLKQKIASIIEDT